MNVLIVDDEPLARAGMRMLLEEESAITSIGEARNGAEAVAVIRAGRPDLLLLDVQMPEMDGFGAHGAPGGLKLGLANTRARLKQLYGDASELRTGGASAGGALVTMILPFHFV